MSLAEQAWGKYEPQLGKKLGAKSKAAIKVAFLSGYHEAAKDAVKHARRVLDESFEVMCGAERECAE